MRALREAVDRSPDPSRAATLERAAVSNLVVVPPPLDGDDGHDGQVGAEEEEEAAVAISLWQRRASERLCTLDALG
eukprot:CAMPEP_0183454334 /NCGR_PEP_ID=MMETSP0370-20130417/123675_1 /TAXON_ID=268820 /ORGANISM="Peridinium aciculiferum, Strain PAER-2" /LENGTH=75 /DNA_ID=CAMNT_0025645823 /DNA_START=1 /DNA_END=225 /DNA_ORIENTATION=-